MDEKGKEKKEGRGGVALKVALLILIVYLYFEYICLVDIFSWLVN